jgi:tetratricopeptide (TPR) repeat protein
VEQEMPLRLVALSILLFAGAGSLAQSADLRDRIVELFGHAQADEQAQDYAGAVSQYREILKLSPEIAEVWSNLGADLFRLQRESEAIAAFEHAALLKPSLLAPHLFTGKAYLDQGQPQEAIAPLKKALALAPDEPEVMLALSDAYSQTEQFGAAVRLLQKAIQRSAGSEEALSRLAATYLEWAKNTGSSLRLSSSVYGRLITDQKRAIEHPDVVEAELSDTVASAPALLEARLDLVDFLLTHRSDPKSLEKSGQLIDAGLQNQPHNPSLLAASVRLSIAQHDEADTAAKIEALGRIDPDFAVVNLDTLTEGLSASLKLLASDRIRAKAPSQISQPGSYSSRLSQLQRAQAQRALSATESGEYASAAWHLHRYRDSLDELAGRPQLSDAEKYWLFRTCAELGKQVLQQTVASHPDSVRTHLLLADFAVQQGQMQTARTEYQAALALRPNDPEIVLLYIRFLETAGELKEATETAERAAAASPGHAGLSFEAGHLILLSGGDMASAARFLQQSIDADPRPFEPHVDLAKVLAEQGRLDEAVREMNLAINHDEDGSMHFLLSRWYRQLGRADDASKAMETCQKIKLAKLQMETRSVSKKIP